MNSTVGSTISLAEKPSLRPLSNQLGFEMGMHLLRAQWVFTGSSTASSATRPSSAFSVTLRR